MKKYVLVRFDFYPNSKVTEVMREVSIKTEKPGLMVLPGTIVTIFKSERSMEEINGLLKKIPNNFYMLSDSHIISVDGDEEEASLTQQIKKAVREENYELAAQLKAKQQLS